MQQVPLVVSDDLHHCRATPCWGHIDFHAIYFIEQGRGVHVIDSTPFVVSRGDVYVMGPGSEHTFLDCERLLLHAMYFTPRLFDRATWKALASVPGFEGLILRGSGGRVLHLTPAAYGEIARDLAQLLSEWRAATPWGLLLVRSLFLNLLIRLSRLAAGESPPRLHPATQAPPRQEIVAAAVRTIDLYYGETLRVK
jgi:hypothetical protein